MEFIILISGKILGEPDSRAYPGAGMTFFIIFCAYPGARMTFFIIFCAMWQLKVWLLNWVFVLGLPEPSVGNHNP